MGQAGESRQFKSPIEVQENSRNPEPVQQAQNGQALRKQFERIKTIEEQTDGTDTQSKEENPQKVTLNLNQTGVSAPKVEHKKQPDSEVNQTYGLQAMHNQTVEQKEQPKKNLLIPSDSSSSVLEKSPKRDSRLSKLN